MEGNKTDKVRMAKAERKGKKREKKKEFRKLTVEEEIKIARVIEEKKEEEEEEENLIELRMVEEMISRQFHKYLKVFEKKESEIMPMRKT